MGLPSILFCWQTTTAEVDLWQVGEAVGITRPALLSGWPKKSPPPARRRKAADDEDEDAEEESAPPRKIQIPSHGAMVQMEPLNALDVSAQ